MKNNPAPKPNASAPRPISLFICSAAKERFERSSAAKKTTIQTSGNIRNVTWRMTARSLPMVIPSLASLIEAALFDSGAAAFELQISLLAVVGLGAGMKRKRKIACELAHVDVLRHARRGSIEPFIDLS